MEYIVKIIVVADATYNVKRFTIEKPEGFHFIPGQATDLSINETKWKDKKHPFTFTSLNSDPHLEFTIKIFSNPEGVTNRLGQLKVGDELIISDAWGAIEYKGPGYFIAGGAGVTPFIAILRQLYKDGGIEGNTLFFSNKTDQDIILAEELKDILGSKAHFMITAQEDTKNDRRRIDKSFLKTEIKDFKKHFYVCGPDQMVADINNALAELGAKADLLIFEK